MENVGITGNVWYDSLVLPMIHESPEATAVFVPLGGEDMIGRQLYVKDWSPMTRGCDAERVKWHVKVIDNMREEHGGVR